MAEARCGRLDVDVRLVLVELAVDTINFFDFSTVVFVVALFLRFVTPSVDSITLMAEITVGVARIRSVDVARSRVFGFEVAVSGGGSTIDGARLRVLGVALTLAVVIG